MNSKTNPLKQNLKNVSRFYTSSRSQNEESSKERPIWQEILIASSGPIIIHLGQRVIDKVFDWLHPEDKEGAESKENSDIKVTTIAPTPEDKKEIS
jgi:hypothetical protein